jgi:hypothetical protein
MTSEPAALVSVCVAYMLSRLRVGRFHPDDEEEDNPCDWIPRVVTDGERQANLDKIYNCTDVESVSMLRMRKAPFFNLVKLFRERSLLEDTIHYCVEEHVAMFLHIVGHNQRYRVIHHTFRRSFETVSRYFHHVLHAVGELRAEMIRAPSGVTHPKILDSHRWYPYFKVLGLIHMSMDNATLYLPTWYTDPCMLCIVLGLYWSYRWDSHPS